MAETIVSPRSLADAISDILEEYGDSVYIASEKGLDAAEKVMVKNLKEASPKNKGSFVKSWKGTGKKYKLGRFVGNTVTIKSKGRNIALSNIFEHSTTNHAKPFIKQTFESSVEEMARAMINTIKEEA